MNPEATFDREVEWLSVLKIELDKVYKEGSLFYNNKVKPLISEAKLLELIRLGNDYDNLMARIALCKPLTTLSEEILYNIYKSGIKIAGVKPFTNFTKENSEAFYRMKLRLIE